MKKNQESKKEHSNMKWVIQSFIMTFILSMIFAYVSTNGVSNLSLIPALLILILVVFLGILFDIIGVAVQLQMKKNFMQKQLKK